MTDESAITSIAVAVVRQDDRLLIGKRAAGGPLADYWEFPGGKVRAGEDPATAAARECREETGLDVRVGPLLAEVEHTYPHGRLRLHFFLCAPADPARPPADRFVWVRCGELDRYEFPPANRQVIDRLMHNDRPAG